MTAFSSPLALLGSLLIASAFVWLLTNFYPYRNSQRTFITLLLFCLGVGIHATAASLALKVGIESVAGEADIIHGSEYILRTAGLLQIIVNECAIMGLCIILRRAWFFCHSRMNPRANQ